MSKQSTTFQDLYQGFSLPLSKIDCGKKCGPYNDYGVPICCDINLVVPTAFKTEWDFLESATDLWHQWDGLSTIEGKELIQQMQPGQKTLQCLGHQHCQRSYRTITCRAFPFFPYLDSAGRFLGLAYYREYREQCWIISNLSQVTIEYKKEFQNTYNHIFELYPETRADFLEFSTYMRRLAISEGEKLIIMDFEGQVLNIDPLNENTNGMSYRDLDLFGSFKITRDLVFPDEIDPE